MKSKKKAAVVVGVVCVLATFSFAAFSGALGLSSGQVEQDARKRLKIDSTWQVSQSFDKNLYVMVFYNEALDHSLYSIYRNQTGLPIGYSFTAGDSVPEGVSGFSYGAAGEALLSRNKEKVEKIQFGSGEKTTILAVDPTKPFAAVVSGSGKEDDTIALYDDQQREVSIAQLIIPE